MRAHVWHSFFFESQSHTIFDTIWNNRGVVVLRDFFNLCHVQEKEIIRGNKWEYQE